eukprot:4614149-Pyramimonas_sp.AAC.1
MRDEYIKLNEYINQLIGCRLQTCRGFAAQKFDSSFRALGITPRRDRAAADGGVDVVRPRCSAGDGRGGTGLKLQGGRDPHDHEVQTVWGVRDL